MLDPKIIRATLTVFLLFFVSFSLAGQAAGAAPAAGAAYTTSGIHISEIESDQYSPDVAYNSARHEYLVVWENLWAGGHHDIYAQRVSEDGRLLSWFAVASGSYKQMNPSVAYDPIHDRYLVVWAYDTANDGSNWDIYGRFIPWSGPSLALTDFAICDWSSNQRRPVVAFAYSQQEYLVTWTNAPAAQPTYISARRIFADGSGFPAGPFLVSSGTENRDYQDVTYNLARNEYLVTWDVDKSGTGLDIYGVRLNGSGSALTGGDPSVTGEFPIAGWPAVEERPAVAACSQLDQYLVAWQSDQDTGRTDYAIYARTLSGEAVPGSVYLISDTAAPQMNPDVTCNYRGSKYLLAWQDKYVGGEYGIWGRESLSGGTSFDSEYEVFGPRSQADRQYPALAGGRSSFLAVWEHDRDGGTNIDIFGRLLTYPVYLPLIKKN